MQCILLRVPMILALYTHKMKNTPGRRRGREDTMVINATTALRPRGKREAPQVVCEEKAEKGSWQLGNKRHSPQALHTALPSPSRLHRGVVDAPQLAQGGLV